MSHAYQPYPYSKTFLIFREREGQPNCWAILGEETYYSSCPIEDGAGGEQAIRFYMSRTGNTGGRFATVPKDVWERINARALQPEVDKVVDCA